MHDISIIVPNLKMKLTVCLQHSKPGQPDDPKDRVEALRGQVVEV